MVFPPHADADTGALVAGKGNPVVVDYFLDFQCPYCAQFEAVVGAELSSLVEDGSVELRIYPMSFLDAMLDNDSSARPVLLRG